VTRKPSGISPKREPSGRLSRSTADMIEAVTPAAAKRMRDAAATEYGDPRWGSELGRLSLHGQLTPTQYEVGRRWGALVHQWWRATGSPFPFPRPGPLGNLGSVSAQDQADDPPVDTEAGQAIREQRLLIIADMTSAAHALAEAGADAERAVRVCCESDDHHVGHVGLLNLRAGLDRLARHWRLAP
jgi:hypothetical protein